MVRSEKMKKTLLLLTTAIITATMSFTALANCFVPTSTETANCVTPVETVQIQQDEYYAFEQRVFELINEKRIEAGVPALTYSIEAGEAADIRVKEASIVFSHNRPDGRTCFTVLDELAIDDYMFAGENLAAGFKTPESVVAGWFASEGHKENMLSADYNRVGIGCYKSGDRYYWSQMFLG